MQARTALLFLSFLVLLIHSSNGNPSCSASQESGCAWPDVFKKLVGALCSNNVQPTAPPSKCPNVPSVSGESGCAWPEVYKKLVGSFCTPPPPPLPPPTPPPLPPTPAVKTYKIRGYIKKATTGLVFDPSQITNGNVNIVFVSENGESYTAKVDASTGIYSINLPPGTYTRIATMKGMVKSITTIVVQQRDSLENVRENTVLFSEIFNGWRAILSWGIEADMDSYLLLPTGQKIYYKNKASSDGSCKLDVDNRKGDGPETLSMIFDNASDGSYKYFVNCYTQGKSLIGSGARVVLYHSNSQVLDAPVPAGPGDKYWYVFKLDVSGGSETFTKVNKFTSTMA